MPRPADQTEKETVEVDPNCVWELIPVLGMAATLYSLYRHCDANEASTPIPIPRDETEGAEEQP